MDTKPISIMLIDNNPTFLAIATQFLQEHNDIEVIGTAYSGRAALQLANDMCPDVVLLDLNMSDMHGLEVIPHLRVMLPHTAIIVLTLHNTDSYWQRALAVGADNFISKANMYTDLAPTIRQVRLRYRSE